MQDDSTSKIVTPTALEVPAPPERCGRFAPSPTGPLHFGSLVAALGSWLDARSRAGKWLVRIEDIDVPRTRPGAETAILKALESLGLWWDGEVIRQSTRTARYTAAFEQLRASGRLFPCACTRREIADSALTAGGAATPVYPGTCRSGLAPGRRPRAWRFRVGHAVTGFDDAVQGNCLQNIGSEVGDFIVRRADGPFAYQLAVVVDDAEQGVTSVVRGADLLDSTPRQILLQQALGLPTPAYAHLPVAVNASGEKLSKQTLAPALAIADQGTLVSALWHALRFLGQEPPADHPAGSPSELLEWALQHWSLARVPKVRSLQAPPGQI